MLQTFKNGQGSVVIRAKLLDSSSTTGAGLTGLTSASAGLIISTIADNEVAATAYTVAGSTIESITTLGTYAAPTATKCRFKELDSTNHKGVYEFQFADARLAVASAKSLLVSIAGATNLAQADFVVQLQSDDPYIAKPANSNLFSIDSNGRVDVIKVAGTSQTAGDIPARLPAALTANGNMKSSLMEIIATALTETSGLLAGGFKKFFNIATPAATMDHLILVDTVTTYTGNTLQTGDSYARLGAPAGASHAADVAAVKVDTAAVKVQTDKLTFTVPNQIDANVLDWKSSAAPAMTGDAFARLGAPAGASVSADTAAVKADTAAIKLKTDNLPSDPADASDVAAAFATAAAAIAAVQSDTDNIQTRLPAALTGAGNMKTDALAVNGSTNAAANLARGTLGVVLGTVGSASSTTSIVTSALDPAAAVADQYKGRIVTFDRATTTANLRGQATDITGSTAGGVLAVTALTDAPVSGDTFTIT